MIDILMRWNRWGNAELKGGFQREVMAQIIPFLDSPDIVALIGARRAGKTTVLFQIMDELEKRGIKPEAMLHLNLEEPAFASELRIEVLDQIYNSYRASIYPTGKAYLFLDEIQNVPQWERWVRARNETENIKFFITGSSSQLMSRELGTLLTGRHVSFLVTPLSFKEFLQFKNIVLPEKILPVLAPSIIQHGLQEYIEWGGFPEVVLATDDARKELLLKQYFDDILFRDIAMRHNIRDIKTLRNLAIHLLTQTASSISYQRIGKIFGVSLDLAKAYCHYLQEAFLVDLISYYSLKAAERNRNPQKVYAIDTGLRRVLSLTFSKDNGRMIETIVYHQLQRKNRDGIFYWKNNGEVDFLLRKGNVVINLIQVAEGLEQVETLQRELAALLEAGEQFKHAERLLIVDKMPKQIIESKSIKLLPLWNYLLQE